MDNVIVRRYGGILAGGIDRAGMGVFRSTPRYRRYEIMEENQAEIRDYYRDIREAVSKEEREGLETELNLLKEGVVEELRGVK